ncbi:MAG: sigma-70 family RNA polymerase sigma factor [Calditrichia bacterium]
MQNGPRSGKPQSLPTLEKYLEEISKIPLLKPEEEVSLTQKIKTGDTEALNTLVQSNLRFVVKIAKEYQGQGLPLMDLINEGNLGLIKAATRFDETRGFRFISYAVWWIRQSILQALAEQARVVRLPLNRVGMINKVNQVMRELEQEFNREPTFEEVSEILNISNLDIAQAVNGGSYHVSLDQPINRTDDGNMKEVLDNPNSPLPDSDLIKESLKQEIRRVLNTLSPREREIISMYFGIDRERPLTLEEIGDRVNLTRERVRQIKERALSRLRHQSRAQNLKMFL